jgi:hypothetical protein
MLRKLFALASISVFGCVVSATGMFGCSETANTPASDAGSADSADGKDSGKPGEDEPDEKLCYSQDPIDVSTVLYKPARFQLGSCSRDVFDVIEDEILAKGGTLGPADLKEAIAAKESAACAECVVADDGDTWAPIVSSADGNSVLNLGGCFEAMSGRAACGKAVQQWMACLSTACSSCQDQTEYQSCTNDVQQSACIDSTSVVVATCGEGINSYLESCFNKRYVTNVGGTIQQLCVNAPKDAGSD